MTGCQHERTYGVEILGNMRGWDELRCEDCGVVLSTTDTSSPLFDPLTPPMTERELDAHPQWAASAREARLVAEIRRSWAQIESLKR